MCGCEDVLYDWSIMQLNDCCNTKKEGKLNISASWIFLKSAKRATNVYKEGYNQKDKWATNKNSVNWLLNGQIDKKVRVEHCINTSSSF